MFFEIETFSCKILDVLKLDQKNVNCYNKDRNFHGLSFRTHSDTFLRTDTSEYHVNDNCVTYMPANLDYRRVSKIDEMIAIHFETTELQMNDMEFFYPQNAEELQHLFDKINDLWQKKEVGYKYECASLFYKILAECYSQNFKEEAEFSKLKKSVAYLKENYKDAELSIGEAAKLDFISEVYFRKLFREAYGVSPKKYIIDLRMKNAAKLISQGYYALQEVAGMCGYTDYKYFSTEFKRYFGVSPSKYLYSRSR